MIISSWSITLFREKITTKKYLSSIKADDATIRMLIEIVKLRWKVENEGFNALKTLVLPGIIK